MRAPYAWSMGEKSKPSGNAKKPGRSLKEKRVAKHEKEASKKQAHKDWDNK
jgi:hypothetical protein